MRICYLADPASVHARRWMQYFADKGHDVHLISISPGAGDDLRNINLHTVKVLRGVKTSLQGVAGRTARLIKQIAPDVLHAHFVEGHGFRAAQTGFHPMVLTAWGSDVLVLPKKSRVSKWKVAFALKRADAITCDADHMVDSMVALGAPRERIKLIYFGTDTRKFHPDRRDAGIKETLRLASDALLVISLRSLSPIYDVMSLIEAAPVVLRDVPNAKFLVIGDGEEKECLMARAASLQVSKSVRFLGAVPNEELPRYLASSDVYVSTSLSDGGLAASTAEAMACELPVVITEFGDNRKWVAEGVGGYLVPLKSPELLAQRIVALLKDRSTRERFGRINRQTIEERNDYHKEMAKVEQLYQELVERHRP